MSAPKGYVPRNAYNQTSTKMLLILCKTSTPRVQKLAAEELKARKYKKRGLEE